MMSIFTKYPDLPIEFLTDLRKKRNIENAPFIVQLANDHYSTNIVGVEPASKEEIIYNYRLGGSFSALLTEWFESNFMNEINEIKESFKIKIQAINI